MLFFKYTFSEKSGQMVDDAVWQQMEFTLYK